MDGIEEKKEDSNNMISMQDLHEIETESKSVLYQITYNSTNNITYISIKYT